MSQVEDNILFERIRSKRDTDSYEILFRRWYVPLVTYACNFVSLPDAENVVQDMMTYLWENSGKIVLRTCLSSYLYTGVKNRCLNIISHETVQDKVFSEMKLSLLDSFAQMPPYSVPELVSLLNKSLSELPEEQRDAFEMSRFDGNTYNEIASKTGVSEKTVEYRISQALRRLRVVFEDILSY